MVTLTRRIADEDPAGLTLARLAELVDWCRENGVPMDTVVPKVRATLRGHLRAIAVDLEPTPRRATADDVR